MIAYRLQRKPQIGATSNLVITTKLKAICLQLIPMKPIVLNKCFPRPAVVAEWFQIQVDTHSKTQVLIPSWDYNIDSSEVEILWLYSNSMAPGDMCRLQYRTERRRYQACPMCLSIAIIPTYSQDSTHTYSWYPVTVCSIRYKNWSGLGHSTKTAAPHIAKLEVEHEMEEKMV